MSRTVDFSSIPTRQDAIHIRLEQWGHWCTRHPTGGNVAPMFRLYRSKARQWEMPVIHVQASPVDNLEIERAVRWTPEPHRTILRWAYCFPWVPVSAIMREAACSRQDVADKLVQARDMVKNRIAMKLVDVAQT